ncbi:MAG: cytochrome B [Rhodobacterales bacterium]|nr:MAG: cytochrome B [Rhodobacterales bacterium]
MKSTANRYGTVAIILHWTIAALIFVLMGSGFRAAFMLDDAAKQAILKLHVPLGLLLILLTLLRLLWWVFIDTKPQPVAGTSRPQFIVAKAVQGMFYPAILLMVASGMTMMAMSGAGDVLFGSAPGTLPDFTRYAPRLFHGLGAFLMIALLALHIGGALFHQFIQKDGLLRRMWFGTN